MPLLKAANAAAAKAAAAKTSAGADHDEEKESEGERQHMAPSEVFVKLFANFWSTVQNSTGGSYFPNLYKLVKIYIVQPHSSIERARGFSAQNRIKNPARNGFSVARLELLMRLSLPHRKDGVDLTKSDEILREAATIFTDASVRRK